MTDRVRIEHTRTEWSGTALQYLVGRNNHVRRLRMHFGHHNVVVVLIPRGVQVRRDG
jgi:hypothetical protein